MKIFLKAVLVICLCLAIFVFSGIRLKYVDRDVRNAKYSSMAVKKIFNEVNEGTVVPNEELENEENSGKTEAQLAKASLEKSAEDPKENENAVVLLNVNEPTKTNKQDWRLILVNHEHSLPENFKVELANIDSSRQFDKRAIDELKGMLLAAKKAKIGDLWAQSAYRSVERQEELFTNKVNQYKKLGKTQEEAEMLTRQFINESNTSEHNLGLAVDFNYVNNDFEKTKVFTWLTENAEKYGFILRYRKDKEEITGVAYEPWHWRYVGVEHAEAINELDMCLEEYVQYLEEN